MKLLEKLVLNTVFATQILLTFLLLFEQHVNLPLWLMPLGRMHPLVLHFPIGLLVMVGLLQFFRKEFSAEAFGKIQRLLLLVGAVSTSGSALMGFFLSQEAGYEGSLLAWHKWTGVAVSYLAYGLLLLDQRPTLRPVVFQGVLAGSLLVLVAAGHFGASLTHGENYVLGPLMQEEKAISEDTPVFEAAIAPVLEQKCQSCHNPRKRKGDLDMTTVAALLEGGENGPIWTAGDADKSALIQRALLPLKDEEHMPPDGKPQLTPAEIDLLRAWIADGADVHKPIRAVPEEAPLYAMLRPLLQQTASGGPAYDFPPAATKTVDRLNTPYVSVYPEAMSSPALHARFFVRQGYDPERLKSLAEVKAQLISLNLANMPIGDADLRTLAQFDRLEKLVLNGTDITGATLGELRTCKKLAALALSGTPVSPDIAAALSVLPALKTLYVWNTQISETDLPAMQAQLPGVEILTGYVPDENEVLQLTPPLLVNESQVIESGDLVELKNAFPGAQIRYSLDGEEPDSLNSPLYEGPIDIDGYTEVIAKTYLAGWIASESAMFTFFQKGVTPDSAELISPPHETYPGLGAKSLIDGKKGLANALKSPHWLGFREAPFEAWLYFTEKEVPEVSTLTLSYCLNVGQYIVPPTFVEVWGGADKQSLRRLVRKEFPPLKKGERTRVTGIDLDLPPGRYACFKLVAQPVPKLPAWHRGAGDKGWFFVDEVFLN